MVHIQRFPKEITKSGVSAEIYICLKCLVFPTWNCHTVGRRELKLEWQGVEWGCVGIGLVFLNVQWLTIAKAVEIRSLIMGVLGGEVDVAWGERSMWLMYKTYSGHGRDS